MDLPHEIDLTKLVAESKSFKDVFRAIGYKNPNSNQYRYLVHRIINELKLDVSHFKHYSGRRPSWTDKQLRKAVKTSKYYVEVARKLGVEESTSGLRPIYRRITKLKLDTSHFSQNLGRLRGLLEYTKNRELAYSKVFCQDSKVPRQSLTRYILRHNIIEYVCSLCKCQKMDPDGAGGWLWNGEHITLQIDHINGKNNDNRESNLRWLCGNCHTQTKTFGGRNSCRNSKKLSNDA